ncbi:hypothetical protein [Viridibacillus arvi]|uniref:hypothetical protein n=1 Tax=Viridibacillus arvi TaxID=263475 RepID=UPI003D29E85F
MSLFNFSQTKLGREYSLTFFCALRNKDFIAALTPFGFKVNRDKSITWVSEFDTVFTIKPFKQEGNELCGYIIHFEGEPKTLVQLIGHTLKQVNPQFVNVELSINDGYTQNENISKAQQQSFKQESMLGIYSVNDIGIVLLPEGTAVLQARAKSISIAKVNILLKSIESVATYFKKEEVYDLFTCDTPLLGGLFA